MSTILSRRQLLKAASCIVLLAPMRRAIGADARSKVKRLLLVHGRAQQGRSAAELKKEWMGALEKAAEGLKLKLPEVEVAVPFYGDVLDNFAKDFALPLTSDMHARGGRVQDEFLQFQADYAEAIRQQMGVTDAELAAEYTDSAPRGPLNWKWVQAILRAVDKHGSGVNSKAIETFTRDVFLYSTRSGVRDAVNRIVAEMLTEEPTIIVSHSLGTVVTYNVLQGDTGKLRVPLLATLGSPLAVRAIRDRLPPISTPKSVGKWYNAMDVKDVVALYPLDAANFRVSPAIENYTQVKNPSDNHHHITGYLGDSTVAKRIIDALTA